MAEITEARIRMADDTEALYVGEAADMPRLPEWPFLAIHVENLDAARDLLDVLERSRARKRAGKEPEPEAAKDRAPGPGPLPPKDGPDDPPCPAHADGRHVRTGGAPCACEPARPDAVTPPVVAKTRAHRIREGVEGEPGKVA